MKKLTKIELEEVFVDVRKAYRLLYFYQRRIMDTVDFIANLLYMHVESGYAIHSSGPPRDGSNLNIDRWAWDWLSMYVYEFYLGEKIFEDNIYKVAIAVQADTGFDDANEGVTAIDVDQFSDVEKSATKIYIYIGKNIWKPSNFEDSWFKDANDEYFVHEDNKIFISKRFDLSDFSDEISIRNNVSIFVDFVKSKGINDVWKNE